MSVTAADNNNAVAGFDDLNRRAIEALQGGDDATAEPLFRQCLALSPENPIVLHHLATIARRGGRMTEAEQLLLQATSRNGCLVASFLLLGEIYEAHDLTTQAFQCYKRVLKSVPNEKEVLVKLGDLKNRMGDKPGALECYRMASETDPKDIAKVVKYIHALSTEDQMAALGRAEQLVRDVGDNLAARADALYVLVPLKEQALREHNGQMSFHCARRDELFFRYAASDLHDYEQTHRQLLSQKPGHPYPAMGLGLARFCAGHRAEAAQYFEVAAAKSRDSIWSVIRFDPAFYQELAAFSEADLTRGLPPLIAVTPPMPDAGGVLYLSCNFYYFKLFALPMLCSLADQCPEIPVHAHIMEATEEQVAFAKAFLERLSPLRFALSVERPGVEKAGPKAARSYFHAVRFIRFHQHLAEYNCPLWLMDVDALINRDLAPMFARLRTTDIAMRIRPGRLEPWNQFNACVVGASTTARSREYIRLLAAYIAYFYQRGELQWGIDQLAMYGVYMDMEERGAAPSLALLGDREVDYRYYDDGFVWCNSGAGKFAHMKRVSDPNAPLSADFGGNRFVGKFEAYWHQTAGTAKDVGVVL